MTAPQPLQTWHDLTLFDCGDPQLNGWLTDRALKSGSGDSSRTYVVCNSDIVVGYYCLAAGCVARDVAPKTIQRNMADPIPVVLLGRFAVDTRYQGKGIGSGLLKDAMLRVLQLSAQIGIKAIMVHALSEDARHYYLQRNFIESPSHLLTLFLPLTTIRNALLEK